MEGSAIMPIPKSFIPDEEEDETPSSFVADEPEEEKPNALESFYNTITTPLTDAPSRFARFVGDKIDPKSGEGGYFRGFAAGALEGAGDLVSQFTSPLDLAATVTGAGAVKTGLSSLRRASQGLSGLTALHGADELLDPDSTIAERGAGLVEIAGGIAGTRIPAKPKANAPIFEDLVPEAPKLSPEAQRRAKLEKKAKTLLEKKLEKQEIKNIAKAMEEGTYKPEETIKPNTPEPKKQLLLEAGSRFYGDDTGLTDINTTPLRQSREIPYRKEGEIPRFLSSERNTMDLSKPNPASNTLEFTNTPPRTPRDVINEEFARLTSKFDEQRRANKSVGDPSDPTAQRIEEGRLAAEEEMLRSKAPASFVPDDAPILKDAEVPEADFVNPFRKQEPASLASRLMSETGSAQVFPQISREPRTGPLGPTIDKLMSSLRASKGLRTKQDKMYSAERAKRFADFENVADEGIFGAKKSLSALKGDYKKINRSPIQLEDKEVDQLFTAIKRARITTGEKARSYTALFKILDGGEVPQRNEIALLNDVFGQGFADEMMELHGGLGLVGVKLAKSANTMKAMMGSTDVSAPMRQGLGLIHRKEWRNNLKNMFKYLGNKEYFQAAMDEIETRPNYLLGRDSGLFIANPKNLLSSEEAFASNYVGSIPVARDIVGASERAYVGFLNKLRSDTFDSLLKQAELAGRKPEEVAKDIAKYINTATGRGSLGSLEKMAPELNSVLWSPRLISSRLTTLNPKYYADLDPFVRKEAIKSLFAMAAAGTTIASLGAAAGGKVSLDPTSSDFGKVRFGSKVLDPWGGFQQPVVAASRFINSMAKGKPYEGTQAVGRFMTNKLSPIASLGYDIGTARAFTGEGGYKDRFGNDKTIQRETLNRFLPIFAQDLVEIIESEPDFLEAVGLAVPSVVGAGVQDYPERTAGQTNKRRLRLN